MMFINRIRALKPERLPRGVVFVIPVLFWIPVIFIILMLTGIVTRERDRIERVIRWENQVIAENITKDFGNISVNTLRFSETLSRSLENGLRELGGGPIASLNGREEALEKLMGAQINFLLMTLESSGCSGVFMILDATVNPALNDAENSRAGVFLHNTEPYSPALLTPVYFLRGFTSLAYANGLPPHSDWALEFNVRDWRSYTETLTASRAQPGLSLSRLYHWVIGKGPGFLRDAAAICSIPLVDSDGRIMGVCGFTISAQTFRRLYSPRSENGFGLAVILEEPSAPEKEHAALYSGDPVFYRELLRTNARLKPAGNAGKLEIRAAGERAYTGNVQTIKLYPEGSPFSDKNFSLFTALPRAVFDRMVFADNLRIAVFIAAFFIAGLAVSVFVMRERRRPIAAVPAEEIPPVDLEKLGLSPREKDVYVLLLRGFTMRQIGLEFNISFSTVNSHCRAIYRKLGVNSRTEILVKYGGGTP
jgi:DNA-binding CsgD family transcriptional regulator